MNKSKIKDWLEDGCGATIPSMPFCLNELRKLAKAAMRGNTTLTIVVGDELTEADIKSILDEAPKHINFDYTHCKF